MGDGRPSVSVAHRHCDAAAPAIVSGADELDDAPQGRLPHPSHRWPPVVAAERHPEQQHARARRVVCSRDGDRRVHSDVHVADGLHVDVAVVDASHATVARAPRGTVGVGDVVGGR